MFLSTLESSKAFRATCSCENQAAALFGHVGDAGFIHADFHIRFREGGEPKVVRARNRGPLGFARRDRIVYVDAFAGGTADG